MLLRGAYGLVSVTALLGLVGCSSSDEDGGSGGDGGGGEGGMVVAHPDPDPLPPLSAAPLTTEQVISPIMPFGDASMNPQDVQVMDDLLASGFGDFELAAGWDVVAHTLDGSPPPTLNASPMLLTRFVHLADAQLADDESPARLATFDNPDISGAYRPQEGHECHILNAAVRTINKVHESLPLDFVVLGGDNADNAQLNEVNWFQAILDGSPRVECDSGDDNDPVAGPENDPKDPLFAEGLDMPWYWVTGNHDILNQGNFAVATKTDEAVGDSAPAGTRDWSQPGGPVIQGTVVPDEQRRMLPRKELLEIVSQAGDGHGIGPETVSYGKANYTFDVAGTSLRFVVIDSAAETGGAEGVILQSDIDAFLEPALLAAQAEGKQAILVTHHAMSSLSDGGGFGGETQPDALTPEEFRDFVGSFGNVIMHLAGHSHVHRATVKEPAGGTPYWEVVTAALADFPHQMRMIEVYQHEGFLSIRAVAFDYSTEGDPIAEDGRRRGIVDYTSGWEKDGSGQLDQRNVELWVPLPS